MDIGTIRLLSKESMKWTWVAIRLLSKDAMKWTWVAMRLLSRDAMVAFMGSSNLGPWAPSLEWIQRGYPMAPLVGQPPG